MTTRLVIEDYRHFKFECTYARTVAEAELLLFGAPWDEVWFDHDMDRYDPSQPSTLALAAALSERVAAGTAPAIGRVFVHSVNPSGRRALVAALTPHVDPILVDANDYVLPGYEMNWVGPA